MNKFNRIVLSIIVLILLSSYNPNKPNSTLEGNNDFLKIKKILIINNFLIDKGEIKEKLGLIYKKNIFLIKRKDIENPLKEISFLDKIEVKKKYPNTIIVKIFETRPVAIIYKNKEKYLLDSSSKLITFKNSMNFDKLPKIFGEGAKNHFMHFFNQLESNNFPTKDIKEFYFFQIERWDLRLKNEKTIKFPNINLENAIKKSIELLDREDFKKYNIIDLRVENKIIVE
tara:strand:- start:305 stop:988 length:684 start_codon:yes stop_codon:yes gene_type:complete